MVKHFANNGDPDQMPHSVGSDLGLYSLPNIFLGGFQTKIGLAVNEICGQNVRIQRLFIPFLVHICDKVQFLTLHIIMPLPLRGGEHFDFGGDSIGVGFSVSIRVTLFGLRNTLRKQAYSNILQILPPKTENFQIKNS